MYPEVYLDYDKVIWPLRVVLDEYVCIHTEAGK